MKQRKIYLIGYVCTLTLLATAFLFSPGLITIFTVESSGFETIDLPNVQDGTEIESQGYKYANTSGVIVTTEPVVSCTWKPDNEDDGWVTCEAIFEVENLADNKPLLTAPEIIFDFQDNKSIRNIEISYASAYEVEDEIIVEETTEEIEQTITNTTAEYLITSQEARTPSPGITGRAITDTSQETTSQTTSRTIEVIKPEKKIIQKRKFKNFNILPVLTATIIQQNITNQTAHNKTQDTPQNTTNQNTNKTQMQNITDFQDLPSTNKSATNQTTREQNITLPDTNTTATDEQNVSSSNNNTADTEEPGTNQTESDQNNPLEQEPETSEEPTQEPVTIDESESITEDESNTDSQESSPLEVQESTDQEPGPTDESDTISAEPASDTDSEPSTDESNGADAEENTLQEPEEEPEQTNPLQGLAIRLIGYSVFQDVAIDTRNPFAIRIQFETPKYATNQFNFELKENQFQAMIDPDVSACGTLNTENGVYTLTQNVTATGTCFTISANNVTVDCQGHTLTHSTTTSNTYGIYSTANQTTIQNCRAQKTNTTASDIYSIYLLDSQNSNIQGNTITLTGRAAGITQMGMFLDTSRNNSITNNTIIANSSDAYGIYLQSSSNDNTIANNNIDTNGTLNGYGVYFSSNSAQNQLHNNEVKTRGGNVYSIFLDTVIGSNITENNITTRGTQGYGIFFESSANSTFNKNNLTLLADTGYAIFAQAEPEDNTANTNNIKATNNDAHGIHLEEAARWTVSNNNIDIAGNSAYGIESSTTTNASVVNNNITTQGSSAHGLLFGGTSRSNTIRHNRVHTTGNQARALYLSSSGNFNTIENNTLTTTGNGSHGLYILSSNTNVIANTTITTRNTHAHGIYLATRSTNNTFTNTHVTTRNSSANALFIGTTNHNITLYHGLLNASNANSNDIHVSSGVTGSFWNLTNITFTTINFSTTANGTLTVGWYLDIHTNDTNSASVASANITAWNANQVEQFSSLTDSQGALRQEIISYTQNASTTKHYSNYTINATHPTTNENQTATVNLATNVKTTFTFTATASEDSGGGSGGSGGGGSGSSSGSDGGKNTNTTKIQIPQSPPQSNNNREVLFDINLEIIEKTVPSHGTLLSSIGLINVGLPGEVDATLTYEIRDNNGAVVYQETEVTQVQTQTQFIKNLQMPQLPEGDYTLFVDLTYVGQQEPAQAEDAFTVQGETVLIKSLVNSNTLFLTLITVLTLGIFIVAATLFRAIRRS